MKKPIAVWVCSNSAIDYITHSPDIQVLRSTINFQSSPEVYNDYIDMDSDTFYKHLEEFPDDIPKTAYISIGKVEELVEEAISKGIKDVIVILISSDLSGLYNFFEHYATQVKDRGINLHPFDSKTLVFGETFMAITATNMIELGCDVSEILEVLQVIKENNTITFAVDSLKYLVVNGRLSKSSAMVGNLLKMKPLLELNDGKVVALERIRTTKMAINKMIEHYFQQTENKNIFTYITHAINLEEATRIKQIILDKYPDRQVVICPLSPVVGAHAGPKAIGIGTIDITKLSRFNQDYFKIKE
ncbi:MAG: DegV family protein [Erysipelothrix sp.]|nr:DegV family protein [Erysipelothrix sp.]